MNSKQNARQQAEQPGAAQQLSLAPEAMMSWSDFLLPVMYAITESCALAALLIGLAGAHFFGWEQPFMPLWGPLLLLVSNTWLNQMLKMQPFPGDAYARRRGPRLNIGIVIVIQVLLTLVVVWGSLYAEIWPLWDPTWLRMLIDDLLTFHLPAFNILWIVVVANALYYYGINITRRTKEPSDITRVLFTRGALIGAIILLLTTTNSPMQVELLIIFPLFLACGLSTRAIAYAVMQRSYHLTGLQGSKRAQDNLLFMILAPTCLAILLLALILGLTVNPQMLTALLQLLSPLGILYTAFTSVIAAIAIVVTAPFFWFLQKVGFKTPSRKPLFYPKVTQHTSPAGAQHAASTATSNITTILGFIMLLVIIALLVVASIYLSRKLQRKRMRIDIEERETLWSWSLFWSQLLAFLRYLWQRLLVKEVKLVARPVVEPAFVERERTGEERDIRAIYRAFLQWSTARGQHRRNNETPYEFYWRFNQTITELRPETTAITDVYARARYGQEPPTPEDFQHMQENWQALQRKSLGGE